MVRPAPAVAARPMGLCVPFVIGQWVRGPRFYGRREEIAAALAPGRSRLWIAGLRRVGKTSLLRQLDLLCGAEGGRSVPVFWDLQGIEAPGDLARGFADALLDAEEPLGAHGVAVAEVEDDDLFTSLGRLSRALGRRGSALLLLCDEAEALVRVAAAEPELVPELWRAVLSPAGSRVVLSSSLRLEDLAAGPGAGAALVEGFGAPLYVGAMADDEARALLRQCQLPAASRPSFDEATVETIRRSCGNHPMLLQLVGKRCLELGDAEEALFQAAADRAVDHLFAVDFDLLSQAEREALRALGGGEGRAAPALAEAAADPGGAALRRLSRLGLVGPDGDGRLAIPNRLLAAWLERT